MDPLGNIPVFISVLNTIEEKRRLWVVLRESIIAYAILIIFLLCGQYILAGLHITTPALEVSGGIILFLIAIRLIFPSSRHETREQPSGEPLIVPLAIPLVAGPSALATVLLLATQYPYRMFDWFWALTAASVASTIILLCSGVLNKMLGKKGLIAFERLMGMILTTVAIQMFLSGLKDFFNLAS